MKNIQFYLNESEDIPTKEIFSSFYKEKLVKKAYEKSLISKEKLEQRICEGKEFLGWLDLPENPNLEFYSELAKKFSNFDVLVSIGIGGSYLGIRAIYEALTNPFRKKRPELIFVGHHLSSKYLIELLEYLEDKNFAIVVISKSGTTTEPAIAFRFLFQKAIQKFGEKEIQNRIVVITDKEKGILRKLANQYNLISDTIPDDVGGRYSVLSPVGLVPLSIVGIKIKELIQGAQFIKNKIYNNNKIEENPALAYATYRTLNYWNSKNIEILATYRPELFYFLEWWKQLFGESEGKNFKGIFPASSIFTTDLHSIGQWIQEGNRNIFETLIDIENDNEIKVFANPDDSDGLNYLQNKTLNEINRTALKATRKAHIEGGVPNFTFQIPELNEFYLGLLIFLFEYSCAISALNLEVNPFDQPGVEDYKFNMFRLLKKPGYV
ncbi:MAG: glucose-6-phosphate isomerase [Leptonema sp. (in: bacteria)]